jgi:5'(3')-deoxyribonucleotidase
MLARKIAVDIDEVLCPFFHPMINRANRAPPVAKRYPYVYQKALGITDDESREMIQEFYKSKEFSNLPKLKNAEYALYQMKRQGYKLYAVTGRQIESRKATEYWVHKNFGNIFDDLVLTNSYTPTELPKVDVCLAMGISSIIDDNFKICKECSDKGIKAINYTGEPTYPWCHDKDPNIVRCANWLEVLNEFPSPLFSNSPSDSSDTDPMCLKPDCRSRTPLLPRRRNQA